MGLPFPVRTLHAFDVLHLIVASLKASTFVLFWSIILLFLIMISLAMVMSFAIEPFVTDAGNDQAVRMMAFTYFGTVSKAFVSMFEITMGNWVPISRFLFDRVDPWYGPAMIVYRCIVGFAIIQVITGVFMHETFKAAAADDSIMITQRKKEMEAHVAKMTLLFAEADTSGDGFLSYAEFQEIVEDPRVKTWLGAMQLDVVDTRQVFDLIETDGSHDVAGELSAEDLVRGVSRLKGNARSLDLATALQKLRTMEEKIQQLSDILVSLDLPSKRYTTAKPLGSMIPQYV
ncbi:unnamed protein product [Polarella glacialis]|uniref:EF-hand domain-containing protein n=1 Tax=Polarella glacialis TaxID=89957 RepID=A0A813L469_POLGL|nr:unnamed protein product [Polarella glacialis]